MAVSKPGVTRNARLCCLMAGSVAASTSTTRLLQGRQLTLRGHKRLKTLSVAYGLLTGRRRFGPAFVRVEPVEDVFERRGDNVAVIAAGDFDVFDLDAKLLAGLDHFSRFFDGHGRVFVAVNDHPGNVSDRLQPGSRERSSSARDRPDRREDVWVVDRD